MSQNGPGFGNKAQPGPVNYRPRVMIFGDSVPQAHSNTNSLPNNQVALSSRGWLNWINSLTGFKFYFDHSLNLGVNGDTSNGMVARWFAQVAPLYLNFDWLWMHGPTNDATNGIPPGTPGVNNPLGTSLGNIQWIVNAALGQNKIVVLNTILPRTGLTATQMLWVAMVNEGIRRICLTQNNVLSFDPWRDIADPTTGLPVAGATSDGVHPTSQTANSMAKRWISQYSPVLGFVPSATQAQWDTYDSVNNPKGNYIPNPTMAGTGGTITGINGTMVNGWSAIKISGNFLSGQIVGSSVAPTVGYGSAGTIKQRFVFNIPGAGMTVQEVIQIRADQTTFGSGPPPGTPFYAQVELDLTGVSGIYYLEVDAANYDNQNTQTYYTAFNQPDISGGTPQSLQDGHYMFRTPLMTSSYSGTNLFNRLLLNIGFNCLANTGVGTIDISNPCLKAA
jgi:lysophospholipase L1-like esterase